MTKPQKAGEPSMEEILASIRKIIADDPVSNRKSVSNDQAPPSAALPAPQPSIARRSALDDILGLADPAANASIPAATPSAAASTSPTAPPSNAISAAPTPRAERRPAAGEVPSWLFPAPVSAPAAPPPQSRSPSQPVTPPPATAMPVAQPVPSISIAPEPFFQPASAKPAPDQPAKAEPAPARSMPAPSQRNLDIGAIVPGRSEATIGSAPSDRKSDPARIPEWMARTSATRPEAVEQSLPSFSDNPPHPTKPSEAPLSVAARIEMATERTEIVRPVEPASAAQGPAAKTAINPSETAAQKPIARDAGPEPVKSEQPTPSVSAAASAPINQTAAQPPRASVPFDTPKPELQSAQDQMERPANMVPVPVVETAPAVSRPAVMGARATKVAPSVEVMPTVLPGSSVRTLEDTVVDLLRPMIRQWLDDNMPRMVEKALRIELAEQVKPKVDTKQKH